MKTVSRDEVLLNLEKSIEEDIELFTDLIKGLKHGETKRLCLSMVKYPLIDDQFAEDEVDLRKAQVVSRRLMDNLVSLGVEGVADALMNINNENEIGE